MDRRIICIGGIFMDVLMEIEAPPKPGQTAIADSIAFIPGGKSFNHALAAKRLGGKNVLFAGRVGKDISGSALLETLKKEGFSTEHVSVSDTAGTGTAVIMVDRKAENFITGYLGSTGELNFAQSKLKFLASDIVVFCVQIPLEFMKEAKKAGATVILNASPVIEDYRDVFKYSDYIVVNEDEAAEFAKSKSIPSEEREILAQIGKIRISEGQTIVITLGHRGVMAGNATETIIVNGIKVDAVDTSGAGDCFMGAFAVALSEGKSLEKALAFANSAAAISVGKKGTSTSFPMRGEVHEQM